MAINTVAILSPGDMGHAVGQLLREHELKVVTCLTGRSERTRALAQQAGIADLPDMNQLVQQSDLVMSITVSEVVPQVCRAVAEAIRAIGRDILFAECNAIAPIKAREMEPIISSAGESKPILISTPPIGLPDDSMLISTVSISCPKKYDSVSIVIL